MHRIDTAGNVDGLFADPNPIAGQIPVVVDSAWLNDVQENIMAVLTAAGIAPVKGTYTQLRDAIEELITSLTDGGVTSFNTRTGAITLTLADVLAVAGGGLLQPGDMIWTASPVARAGLLLAQGQALARAGTYANLYAAIGTTFGEGDGETTFNAPDGRAAFIRGLDAGAGIDVGRTLGSLQLDQMQAHWHAPGDGQTQFLGDGPSDISTTYTIGTGGPWGVQATTGDAVTDGVHGAPRLGSETRPRNLALNLMIKY